MPLLRSHAWAERLGVCTQRCDSGNSYMRQRYDRRRNEPSGDDLANQYMVPCVHANASRSSGLERTLCTAACAFAHRSGRVCRRSAHQSRSAHFGWHFRLRLDESQCVILSSEDDARLRCWSERCRHLRTKLRLGTRTPFVCPRLQPKSRHRSVDFSSSASGYVRSASRYRQAAWL